MCGPTRYAAIARDHDPALYGIALDHDPVQCSIGQDLDPMLCDLERHHDSAVCRIERDQNGIALDQLIKFWSQAVRLKEKYIINSFIGEFLNTTTTK
jgi:hypothetical protein